MLARKSRLHVPEHIHVTNIMSYYVDLFILYIKAFLLNPTSHNKLKTSVSGATRRYILLLFEIHATHFEVAEMAADYQLY